MRRCRRVLIGDRARWSGFSLIELLVVIAILSVLASVALPLAELATQRHKEDDLRRSLREIRSALDQHKKLVDQGRIQRPADGSGYPPTLDVLVTGIVDAQSPQGSKLYLMRRLPRDPMAPSDGSPPADTWGVRSYASAPDRPERGKDVFDVYSLSLGRGLNGVPYREW